MVAGRWPYGGGSFRTSNFVNGMYGDVFFVDNGHDQSSDSSSHGMKRKPLDSINFASTLCTANNGDTIVVGPGHAETVSSAGALAMAVAGVRVLGIGWGTMQPTITLDTADTADVDINAANVIFQNMHFRANFADIGAGIDVNADDFSLLDCRFSEVATDMNVVIWVQDGATTTSDRITIEGCTAKALDAANTHFVNFGGTGDGHIVRNNLLMGDWGTMCIGGAGIVTYCTIDDNKIYNAATGANGCINVPATATGIISNNRCTGGHATDGITVGDCGSLENYYELSTSDLSGVIEPAIA